MKNLITRFTTAVLENVGAPVRDGLLAVRDAEATKRREHEQAVRELEEIRNASPPKADVIKRLKAEVQQIGEAWLARTAQNLVALGGHLEIAPSGAVTGIAYPSGGLWDAVPVDLGFACAVHGDVLIAKFTAAVERLSYAEGPPMAERGALLRDLAERIPRLAKQHQNLVDAAAELGVRLEPLPENKAARLRQEREAEARLINDLYKKAHAPVGQSSPQARLDAQIALELEQRRQRGARS